MLDQAVVIIGVTVLVLFSPGPDMVIVMKNTISAGRRGGLLTSAGILTGNLVHITYCVIGIGLLISQSIVAFSILRYAGAAYLVYLGIATMFAGNTNLEKAVNKTGATTRGWFLQGFINNVLNPKGTLFYLGVFTMVITPDTTPGVMTILIFLMMTLCAVFWLFFVATLDHPAVRRRIFRAEKAINAVFGILLVTLGLRVALLER